MDTGQSNDSSKSFPFSVAIALSPAGRISCVSVTFSNTPSSLTEHTPLVTVPFSLNVLPSKNPAMQK